MPDRVADIKQNAALKRSGKSRDPLDIQIGQRIRKRREDYRISQARLGGVLGVTQQQVQKYESGKDSIHAATLYRLAHQLGVPMMHFFDENCSAWTGSHLEST